MFKRDDLWNLGHATGAKSRTMVKHHAGAAGLISGGTRISPQIERVALTAKQLGVPCRVHTGNGKLTAEMQTVIDAGGELLQHRPGYLTVISKRLHDDAAAHPDWQFWPFGMGRQEYIDDIAIQVAALDLGDFNRIVVPCGSAMTLLGILQGLDNVGAHLHQQVHAITLGADPTERLDKFRPGWREDPRLTLTPSGIDYDKTANPHAIEGITLDPHYEAKCVPFLKERDLLWIVGLRQSHATKSTTTHVHMSQPTPPTPATEPATPTANTSGMRALTEPTIRCAHSALADPRTLRPHPRNPNEHPAEQIRLLLKIIDTTGWRSPIVVSKRSGLITKGHGRLETALLGNFRVVPVDYQDYASDEEEIADVLADNLVADLAVMNRANMKTLLAELTASGYDTELAGMLKQQSDLTSQQKKASGALKERFIISPFTILDARGGDWMQRRNLWLQLGIESETGRSENLTFASSSQPPHVYAAKNNYETKIGRVCSWDEFFDQHPDQRGKQNGTSIFNPVLCEIMYNWFLPSKGSGKILDPFAGGSVRGIVAAVLGHAYTGIELRPEQVAANIANADAIFEVIGAPLHRPRWICGDSTRLDAMLQATEKFDLVFTCPPYGDLEVYSDNPEDLSAQPEQKFRDNYSHIIKQATGHLLPNRFSIWIIGDYRDKKTGILRNFVNTTINAHPFPLYNHAVLLTAVSSLAIRIGKNFPKMRKLGKAHQDAVMLYNGNRINLEAAADAAFENVVMFLNGTASKIPEALGPIGAREVIPLGDILAQLTGAKETDTPAQDQEQPDNDAPILDALEEVALAEPQEEPDAAWEDETDSQSTTTLPAADPATDNNLPPLSDDSEDDERP